MSAKIITKKLTEALRKTRVSSSAFSNKNKTSGRSHKTQ